MADSVETVVVGAGVAGLAYAHARGDADLVVLESAGRPGGLVHTGRRDDVHFELGPEALQEGAAETDALLAELGLAPSYAAPAAGKRFLLRPPDQLVALPAGPGGLLTTPLLSPLAKLRLIGGLFRGRRADLDGTLADFVRARFGAQVLERLADPAVSGVWAGDPERLSLAAAVPRLHASLAEHGSIVAAMRARGRARRAAAERAAARSASGATGAGAAGPVDAAPSVASDAAPDAAAAPRRRGPPRLLSLAGGLQTLTDTLAARLGERLLLDCPVHAVARDGDGWCIDADDGRRWRARRLVLALPPVAAAALTAAALPELSADLAAVESASIAVVIHAWRRADVGHPLDGFGYLVASSLGRDHLGTLFSSSIQPARCPGDRVLLRTLVGGVRRPELVERSDAELADGVVAECRGPLSLAVGAEPLFVAVRRQRAALPCYAPAQVGRLRRLDIHRASLPGLSLIGNHVGGLAVNGLIEASRELAREHG